MSIKTVRSENYNYVFNTEDGFFARWGKTKEEDPCMSPFGPEIADIELSTICNLKCKACYKSNTDVGINMSLATIKNILGKFDKRVLCQVAYGIGSVKGNPDLWDILNYTRSIGVVPNITVNGKDIEDDEIVKLANVCGAVSVSHYGTVKRLTEAKKVEGSTLRQVNIHVLCSESTLDKCYSVIKAAKEDERLKDLNAIVLMTLKPKGTRNVLKPLNSLEKFQELFKYAVDSGISIGMDSCAAPMTFKAIEKLNMLNVAQSCESCEVMRFSSYINVLGVFYPCSFSEGEGDWKEGLSVLDAQDFVKDIWFHPRVVALREKTSCATKDCDCQFKDQCRPCFLYDITPCHKK
jgi:MoaA/NifB/PqqE/SkfB family radical SAM enzyme